MADVLANHLLVPPHRRHEVASCPKVPPDEVAPHVHVRPCDVDRALSLMNPTTCTTESFGGIDSSTWTWSGIRCPSSTRHSFCSGSVRNTVPRFRRSSPKRIFRRYFGMNTT